MSLQPDPVEHMVRQAAQQRQAEQMLQQLLTQTMQSPARQTVLHLTMIALGKDDEGRRTLMLATPSGERIDVPLSPQIEAHLRRALAEEPSEA